MSKPSGAEWCAEFPTSKAIDDLTDPFKTRVRLFSAAIMAGKVTEGTVTIAVNTTKRPKQRAFLMHFACLIVGYKDKTGTLHQIAAAKVPALAGVDIDWTHGGDDEAAIVAAKEMVAAYDIAFPAALYSLHIDGLAIDWEIHWKGTLTMQDAHNQTRHINTQADLHVAGATFGVIKLLSDEPHWSYNGH